LVRQPQSVSLPQQPRFPQGHTFLPLLEVQVARFDASAAASELDLPVFDGGVVPNSHEHVNLPALQVFPSPHVHEFWPSVLVQVEPLPSVGVARAPSAQPVVAPPRAIRRSSPSQRSQVLRPTMCA
jgi:hypothetical protein